MKSSDYSRRRKTKKTVEDAVATDTTVGADDSDSSKPMDDKKATRSAKSKPALKVPKAKGETSKSSSDEEEKPSKPIKTVPKNGKGKRKAPKPKPEPEPEPEECEEEEPEVVPEKPKKAKSKASPRVKTKKAKVSIEVPPTVCKWVKRYVLSDKLKDFDNVIEASAKEMIRLLRLSIKAYVKDRDITFEDMDDETLYRMVMEVQWAIVQWPKAIDANCINPAYNESFPISVFDSDEFRVKTVAVFRKVIADTN